jgi:glycosyltransferase involved in cell wall biosynthesis
LPLIQQQKPQVRLLIAGASPHPSVKTLASESVTVSGWLDDIRTAYASSKIFVAPMQIGTGLKNKLLEAMAMKIPSVCSDLANTALAANANTEICVSEAQDAESFAKHIIELLDDEEKAKIQAEAAYKFVLNNYSWKSSVDILERVMIGDRETENIPS